MATPKIVIVMSPPRCGSMWLYNAIRRVCRSAGRGVAPDHVPIDDADLANIFDRAAADAGSDTVYVAKTHRFFVAKSAEIEIRAATALRDPRDMVVSLLNLPSTTHLPRAPGPLVAGVIDVYDKIFAHWGEALHVQRYADIVGRPAYAVARLRAALGLPPAPESDAEIAAALSPAAVGDVVRRAEAGERPARTLGGDAGVAIDLETGFQTGHIGDRATEKWREHLSAEDAAAIAAQFGGWLQARGFPVA